MTTNTRETLIKDLEELAHNVILYSPYCEVPLAEIKQANEHLADFILNRERKMIQTLIDKITDANINERPTGQGVSELISVKKVVSICKEYL